MFRTESFGLGLGAIGLLVVLWVPRVRDLLEATMSLHMLVQLPLLAFAGYCVGVAWRQQQGGLSNAALASLQRWNVGGATGVVFAGIVMVFWMLPRGLDTARFSGVADVAKFVTIALAGLAVALSWSRMHVIARGVIHLEVIATLFRFGWGYLSTDSRLCLAYLSDDQQRTGEWLLWLGAVYALIVVWRPLVGSRAGQQVTSP